MYANTHTKVSGTGLRTTRFCEKARKIIHEAVHGVDQDVVLFTSSGVNGAIDKLIGVLNWRIPNHLDKKYSFYRQIVPSHRPVVSVGGLNWWYSILPPGRIVSPWGSALDKLKEPFW